MARHVVRARPAAHRVGGVVPEATRTARSLRHGDRTALDRRLEQGQRGGPAVLRIRVAVPAIEGGCRGPVPPRQVAATPRGLSPPGMADGGNGELPRAIAEGTERRPRTGPRPASDA